LLAADTTNAFSFNGGTSGIQTNNVDGASGVTTSNSDVTLTADHISLAQAVNAGSGTVTLQPFTPSQTIELGGSSNSMNLGLSDLVLGQVTAGVLRIGNSSQTGGIIKFNPITRHAGYNTLSLITGSTIGAGAPISVANLAVMSSGTAELS